MKLKTVFLGLIAFSSIWIIFPYLFIKLNQFLGLPEIHILPLQILGVLLIILGLATYSSLTLIFHLFGEGTPLPTEPPKKIVIEGLYKYSRNPMYLCHLIIFLGDFLLFGSSLLIVYLILFWLMAHLIVIFLEEPDLKRRFGKEYADYCRRVPRWF